MDKTTKMSAGRWIAAGLVLVLLAAFALFLASQDDEGSIPEVTPSVVARLETPTAQSTATREPAAPNAQPSPTGEPATATSARAATATDTPQPATATPTATVEPPATPTSTPTETPLPTATLLQLPVCEVECVEVGVTLENFPGPLSAISAFGELSGRMPDIVMFFQAWGDADAPFKPWLPDLAAMEVSPLDLCDPGAL